MIIAPDGHVEGGKAAEARMSAQSAQYDVPPPSYTPSSPTSESSATMSSTDTNPNPHSNARSPSPVRDRTPLPRPTNHVVLVRPNNPIKGIYAIDPFLTIPPALLPPLSGSEQEQDRKNLILNSRNGSIDVDIHIVGNARGDDEQKHRKKAKIDLISENGTVSARLRHSVTPRIPFAVSALARNGAVTIRLPRTFHGPITITANNGSVSFSDELTPYVTTLGEVSFVRTFFVGDFAEWDGVSEWKADELKVEAKNGRVRVRYVDEGEGVEGGRRRGFLGRWMDEWR